MLPQKNFLKLGTQRSLLRPCLGQNATRISPPLVSVGRDLEAIEPSFQKWLLTLNALIDTLDAWRLETVPLRLPKLRRTAQRGHTGKQGKLESKRRHFFPHKTGMAMTVPAIPAVPLPPVLYLFNQLVKFVWLHLATVELPSMLYQAIKKKKMHRNYWKAQSKNFSLECRMSQVLHFSKPSLDCPWMVMDTLFS